MRVKVHCLMLTECVTGAYILYVQKVDSAILTNKTESLQFFNPLHDNQFSDFFLFHTARFTQFAASTKFTFFPFLCDLC